MSRTPSIPKLCHHKGSGRDYVTIDRRQRYLGLHGSVKRGRNMTASSPSGLPMGGRCWRGMNASPAPTSPSQNFVPRIWATRINTTGERTDGHREKFHPSNPPCACFGNITGNRTQRLRTAGVKSRSAGNDPGEMEPQEHQQTNGEDPENVSMGGGK